ncbi:MAG: transporter substrate-binding domain-containing protein [Chitinispirillales bacterium]|nr:transporter substrate-binding domain-containing protein [Chitinispirillales bacterium]
MLAGCGAVRTPPADSPDGLPFTSYRDIPGVTKEEILAVEAIRGQLTAPLIYGMTLTTEMFISEDGVLKGFAVLFCEFLTSLFDMPFEPRIYKWDDLIVGLESGEIAFTGDLTPTEERRKIYFMTDPIALRTVKHFRLAGSRPIAEIAARRPLRYAFLAGTITGDDVKAASRDSIEMFFVDNYDVAYDLLKEGKIDAFFDENSAEYILDNYTTLVMEQFFPLLYASVSMTTKIPVLEPIISVVQKMLENGGGAYLAKLSSEGQNIYKRDKFLRLLSEEEREYLNSRAVIPFLAESHNYPTSFYSRKEKQWQGVAIGVIGEIENLTGLHFQIINDYGAEWDDLLMMLESGQGSVISQLVHTQDREGRFLWPATPLFIDYYTLLSRVDFRDIGLNDIFYMTVGIIRGSIFEEVFKRWFPDHPKIVEFDDAKTLFKALERGEIDLAMSNRNNFLYLTNFLKQTRFKINYRFDLPVFESTFGIYKGDSLLLGIIDKALVSVNTREYYNRWARNIYNHSVRLAGEMERLPLIFGIIGLLLCVLILVFILMLRSRREGKRLERNVQIRTLELKESQEELKEAVLAAENANRAKSNFLATVSHEIRTPMNAIIGISQIQLQRAELPGDYEEAFYKIYRSGNSLLGIINDILDLSKIEAGKLELNPGEYDVPSFINDAVQVNIIRIGSKKIQLTVDPESSLPSKLYGDDLRLKQILNNLLSNAIKYTDKGHVKLSISHLAAGEDVVLRFSVEDTGQGLTPDDKANLFSEYRRFNTSANRIAEGTGLGLSITKRLAEMMDGKIEFESEYGKGSVFTVEVRQKRVPCEPIGEKVSENLKKYTFTVSKKDRRQIIRNVMPYGKVLIVDDVDTNLYVANGLLAPYQLDVETADSGFAVIELVESGKVYDIIFMDHMMPKMDGIETAQKLRAMGYAAPIIALTANALTGNAEMFRQNGFDGFISKPIDIHFMDEALNKFVRDRHPEEAKRYSAAGVKAAARPSAVNFELLKIFRRDAEKAVATLRQAITNDDAQQFTITAHAMKSALANVGESDKSQIAASLEKAGKSGDADYIGANIENFINALEELIERYDKDSESAAPLANDAGITEDTAYLAQYLDAIKTACEKYDDTAVFQALDRLKEKTWKRDTTKILENIRELVYTTSDFEAAAENIQKLSAY